MPDTLCRVGAPYVSCGTFAISAIRLQSQQSDCNLSNQTAISTIRLQSYIAVSGLHLDYTERKIQSMGNVLKVLAHGIHQAVRFTWV